MRELETVVARRLTPAIVVIDAVDLIAIVSATGTAAGPERRVFRTSLFFH